MRVGLLSSFGELEYACNNQGHSQEERPVLVPWEPDIAADTSYPITSYQPKYFVAERYDECIIMPLCCIKLSFMWQRSLSSAKEKMRKFCDFLPKPFHARYKDLTKSIWVDRAVVSVDK